MRITRTTLYLLTSTAICAGTSTLGNAQQNAEQITVTLSNSSRPATVRADLKNSGLTVRGENRRDVLIQSDSAGDTDRGRSLENANTAGLRRLSQPRSFIVTEQNNELQIDGDADGRGSNVTIHVPRRTNLKLSTTSGGPIVVENVDGELELQSFNSSIALTNVAGSVVANAPRGSVRATLTRLTAGKAMSFISFGGSVDVTLPASTKANLKMRSDNGEIWTDFDVQARAMPTPSTSAARRTTAGQLKIEVDRSVYGSINGGGPEFELRTFNGSIHLRKARQ